MSAEHPHSGPAPGDGTPHVGGDHAPHAGDTSPHSPGHADPGLGDSRTGELRPHTPNTGDTGATEHIRRPMGAPAPGRLGERALPPRPPRQPAPRTPNQPPKRRFGRGAMALGLAAAVVAGAAYAEYGPHETKYVSTALSAAGDKIGSIFADDNEEAKPEKEVKPGGPIFEPTAEMRVKLYDGPKLDPYNWGPEFKLNQGNIAEAVTDFKDRAYYKADVAAVHLSELGYSGEEGVQAAPDKDAFASDAEYQQAVRAYADYLNADRAAAEKALAWHHADIDTALKDGKLSVEAHDGINYKTWGQELGGGRVYIEDNAYGSVNLLKKVNADGSISQFNALCGWQTCDGITVPAPVAPAPQVQTVGYASETAPAPQAQTSNVLYAAEWGPEQTTPPPADNPNPPGDTTPPPTTPPPTSPPPTSPPPIGPPPVNELLDKVLPDDFNANQNAINPWGNSQMPAPNKVTPLAPLPDTYKAPATPKVDNGDSSTGGFSGPKIDSNLGNGVGGSTKAPGTDNSLSTGMADLS